MFSVRKNVYKRSKSHRSWNIGTTVAGTHMPFTSAAQFDSCSFHSYQRLKQFYLGHIWEEGLQFDSTKTPQVLSCYWTCTNTGPIKDGPIWTITNIQKIKFLLMPNIKMYSYASFCIIFSEELFGLGCLHGNISPLTDNFWKQHVNQLAWCFSFFVLRPLPKINNYLV